MQYISTTEARADFAAVIAAAQQQPIVIQRQHQDVAVMVSPEDFMLIRKMKIERLRNFAKRASSYAKKQGLTAKKLSLLLKKEK